MSPRTRMMVGAYLALAAWGCTTEDSGIRVGGEGGDPGGIQGMVQDGSADAPQGSGRCEPGKAKPLGAACGCGDECASGFCADGVCCNTRCNGACVSCNQVGQQGECAAVRAGATDPHAVCKKEDPASCGYDGTCTGGGACSRHRAGTICKAPACSGSGLTPASSCDGNGTCLAGSPINCSPSVCADGACKVVCTSNADCATPGMCTGGSCGLRGLGQPCTSTGQCKSGFCADGVCCSEACTGQCRFCALPIALGRCVDVPADTPDPRVARGVTDPELICAAQAPQSCGTNGLCDGSGGCQR
ncbi:MAG TPA: hypothetical protein VN914_20295, partial [Polyangia bacterium]|nr:hypothetical protein [Polyangia bacterium]